MDKTFSDLTGWGIVIALNAFYGFCLWYGVYKTGGLCRGKRRD